MIQRLPKHTGDDTCPSCVVAGDFIFLAHHGGGGKDIAAQMRATFESVKRTLAQAGATLDDMVQIHLYLKDLEDFAAARDVFCEYFNEGRFPARMTSTTEFLNEDCLCQIDGVAYKP